MAEIEDIDFLTDPSVAEDPYPYYDAMRSCPVRRETHRGVVMVTGYEEMLDVLRDDRETYSVCNVATGPFARLPPVESGEDLGDDISDLIEQYRDTLPLSEYIPSFDPPKHTAHRSLLGRLFTPKRLKENEEFLWRLADERIDRFVDDGRCEFITAYGFPFTQLAIADLLGVPESDHERFGRTPQTPKLKNEERNYVGVQQEWFVDYVEDRRREPREDVLTQLAQATFPDGTTPTVIDVARIATFLFAAGQGTTVDHLTTSLLMLAEHPGLQEQLRADRELIPPFVEEMLRLESPIKSNFRLAKRTTHLGDMDVEAGTDVLLLVGAANRDPRRFDSPGELRLDRPNVSDHLAFGRGVHFCPGAALARTESRITLERLLDRFDDIRIDAGEHGPPESRRFAWEPSSLLRKLRALHLELTPAS